MEATRTAVSVIILTMLRWPRSSAESMFTIASVDSWYSYPARSVLLQAVFRYSNLRPRTPAGTSVRRCCSETSLSTYTVGR